MPSLYHLKPFLQEILRPTVRRLASFGATPNQITVLGIVLSALGGGAVLLANDHTYYLLAVPLILLVRMALNTTDGILAREYGMQTRLGALLNELGDVLSSCLLFLPFSLLVGLKAWLVVVVVILAIVSEMAGMLALTMNISRRHDGPMGESDRAAIFGLIALLIGIGIETGLWANILLGLIGILLIPTIINRIIETLKEAKKKHER
ncbi:MAG: CDP-alcohol phosphatidyltransferase family protein [Alphaproteobacteria bacterium]|nr:CDP-alcohol phosphatidyltransferase family protein [Alphaproteobacteria bacterium]